MVQVSSSVNPNEMGQMPEIGIVVPTIGQRPEYLPLALKSIRDAGTAYILLVGNKGFDASTFLAEGLIDQYLDEQDPGLAAKINFGFRSLPEEIKYINWLGDDDLLTKGSLDTALARIKQADQPVLVFGGCEYIDPEGKQIFVNKSGQWAVPLLRFGPQLIPQPGALYRRDAFEKVGGLDTQYQMAFDFELFYSLSEIGKAVSIPEVLAQFRWHKGSLSVRKRRQSVAEASRVRVCHLPTFLKGLSFLWEAPVQFLTFTMGATVSNKKIKN
jgi:glycosyltransferase involved in cell wall biosynthesis